MKYRDPVTGEFKDITIKVADTLPVGTIVEYDGTTIPNGWELVDGSGTYKKIKKTETITATNGAIVDSLAGNSTTDAPSINAVNNKFNELIRTGYILVQAKRGQANPINASIPDGYDFLCWLQVASQGSVLTAYTDNTLSPSANIWLTSGETNVNYTFKCTYLVIKTGMKG